MKLDLDRQEHGRTELPLSGTINLDLKGDKPDQTRIDGTLTVDNLDSRFLLTGTLRAVGEAECSRCLGTFALDWDVPVDIMVLRDVDSDEESQMILLHQKSGELDLREAVRECAVLAYPLVTTCGEDCKGLCVQCGVNRNDTSCNCAEEDYDPRWEGLP